MSAQRTAVASFLKGRKPIAEFEEVESGKRKDRPELNKAIALCRKHKATLLIAKLDRLSRNAAFLFNLHDSGVDFTAVDMPHADKFTVGIRALPNAEIRRLLIFLFGENPNKTGNGITVFREKRRWRISFKGLVEFHHELSNGRPLSHALKQAAARYNKEAKQRVNLTRQT
jgi:hypothetical protein